MSNLLLPFLIMIQVTVSFSCQSYPGNYTSTADDAISTMRCPTTGLYTTLVSCGFEPKYYAEDHVDGGWMVGDSCKAQNGGGQGVRPWARCCDFSSLGGLSRSSSFFGQNEVNNEITSDDGRATSTCSAGEILTGCSVFSYWHHFDGAYPGDQLPSDAQSGQDYPFDSNNCTAQHGYNGFSSTGNKQCLETPSAPFSCVLKYSDETPDTAPYQVTIACSSGYTMMGCSAWGWFNTMNGMWINEVGECIASSHDRDRKVYGIAICCKFDAVPAPTFNPITNNPTTAPTTEPSIDPTESPSIDPTIDPTIKPTIYPTIQPTTSKPTVYPSFNPTRNPTPAPTNNPTAEPISASLGSIDSGDDSNMDNLVTALIVIGGIIICLCIAVIVFIGLYFNRKKSQNDRDEMRQSDVPNKEYLQVNNNSNSTRAVHMRHGNNPNDEIRTTQEIQSIAAMGINGGNNDQDQDKEDVNDGIEMHQI